MAANPIFVATPINIGVTYNNATSTTPTLLYTAGAAGSRIDALCAVSTDTAAHDIQLGFFISSVFIPFGTLSIPAGAGNTSGVLPVDLLRNITAAGVAETGACGLFAKDPYGNSTLWLPASGLLYVLFPVAITSGKSIFITGLAGNY